MLIIAKSAATSITLAFSFWRRGIFSPRSISAPWTGGAFGLIASSVFPELSSSQGRFYAILGMGAVAGAVIGAPISTAVMVFELTGGYALSLALLLTVCIAIGVNQAVHGRSCLPMATGNERFAGAGRAAPVHGQKYPGCGFHGAA